MKNRVTIRVHPPELPEGETRSIHDTAVTMEVELLVDPDWARDWNAVITDLTSGALPEEGDLIRDGDWYWRVTSCKETVPK